MRLAHKLMLRLTLGGVIVAGLVGCDKASLNDDKAKYSYAIGVQIARNLKEQNIALDTKAFSAAVTQVMNGKEPQLNDEERMEALRKMSESLRANESKVADENLKKGEDYLAANKSKEGVKETKSGLQYRVVEEGKGPKPKASDTVEVHYKGRLIDGKEFDSSYTRGQPAQFPVKAVIPGWTEALQLMTVGSKYELTIPASLAYGERGNPSIPGNSVLVFDVELLKIVKK